MGFADFIAAKTDNIIPVITIKGPIIKNHDNPP